MSRAQLDSDATPLAVSSGTRAWASKRDLKSYMTVAMVAILSAAVVAIRWDKVEQPWRSMLLIALVISEALWGMARIQLGLAFAVRPVDRFLVREGLYSRIRNPIYTFGGITAVCLIGWINAYAALAFAFLQIPIQYLRIRKEEALLSKAFGEEYKAYRASTWF